MPEPKLIDLPIEEARFKKWQQGQEEHGPFMILDPLEELFAELLDGINYANELDDEFRSRNVCGFQNMARLLREAAQYVQSIKSEFPLRTYHPRKFPFV